MKKGYILKIGDMYLQYYTTNESNIKTDFVNSIYLSTKSERCTLFEKEDAEELKKKFYILLGIEFELKEMEVDDHED